MKVVGKYNHDKEEVNVTCIGIGGSGNDSRSAAESIGHSLEIFHTISHRNKFDSQGTDAGGGRTGEDLEIKLDGVGRVRDTIEYNISTCTLHAMHLNLSSTTELTMGSEGLEKRTGLQCLHSADNLNISYRRNEWDSIRQLISNEDFVQLTAPVHSRWECVGEACEHVINNLKG